MNNKDHIAVALYVGHTATNSGKQWKSSNHEDASDVADIQTRWTMAKTPEQVDDLIDATIRGAKKAGYLPMQTGLWTYLCLNVNWLSWAWHEQGNEEMSRAWAKNWHKINKFSLDTLKGDELAKYIEEID